MANALAQADWPHYDCRIVGTARTRLGKPGDSHCNVRDRRMAKQANNPRKRGSGPRGVAKNRAAAMRLRWYFTRNGYVRLPNYKRRDKMPRQKYKKGYEVRLVACNAQEIREIRSLLKQLGLRPPRTFAKHKKIVQPVYGQAVVEWFLKAKVQPKYE